MGAKMVDKANQGHAREVLWQYGQRMAGLSGPCFPGLSLALRFSCPVGLARLGAIVSRLLPGVRVDTKTLSGIEEKASNCW